MTTPTTTAGGQSPVKAPDPEAVREAIGREAILKALLDQIKDAYKDAQADVQTLVDQQYAATGSTRHEAVLGGVKVGSITRRAGEKSAQITDEKKFTAWVAETYPSEYIVQITKAVRATFTAALLSQMTAAQAAQYADPETGEVHDVPGVEIKPARARSHALTFSRATKAQPLGGREVIARAWREGQLDPAALLASPALPSA
ncbi:hypothetical protein [Streptomyces sp. CH6]|uniref:hypothetical protein n=1 Tax=unclassified Streptomyces TaxID=2593676 RepID=UPI003D003E15